MKLTENQVFSLISNNKIVRVIQKTLANKVREVYKNAPILIENATEEEIEIYNDLVNKHINIDMQINNFADKYFPLIANEKGKEKMIFINAMADFEYEGIEGLMSDELVDVLSVSTYNDINIIGLIIDQSFKAIMFPPKLFQSEIVV